jgi:hypothetical protein
MSVRVYHERKSFDESDFEVLDGMHAHKKMNVFSSVGKWCASAYAIAPSAGSFVVFFAVLTTGCSQAKKPVRETSPIDWTGITATGFDYLDASAPTDSTRRQTITQEQVARLGPDLSKARLTLGQEQVWTLQVAIYCRPDRSTPTAEELAEFRTYAEQVVAQLREDGETAFYYHTERSSTVTVGIFTNDDSSSVRKTKEGGALISGRGRESLELRSARERHPYNLVNGAGVRMRSSGSAGTGQIQPSVLVLVPEK